MIYNASTHVAWSAVTIKGPALVPTPAESAAINAGLSSALAIPYAIAFASAAQPSSAVDVFNAAAASEFIFRKFWMDGAIDAPKAETELAASICL